uniref:BUB1 N-terminal domain-containing protein n=1 Tax=Heterorhabditis bacteriophora TaxID=37862 RepID=A0A1I7X888_HETBA
MSGEDQSSDTTLSKECILRVIDTALIVCIFRYSKVEKYLNDARMLKIWEKLADNSRGHGWEIYQHANSIGSLIRCAHIYVRWSQELEMRGAIGEARNVLRRGRQAGAHPIDLLNTEEDELDMREMRRLMDSQKNDSWQDYDQDEDTEERVAFTRLMGMGDGKIAPVIRIPSVGLEFRISQQVMGTDNVQVVDIRNIATEDMIMVDGVLVLVADIQIWICLFISIQWEMDISRLKPLKIIYFRICRNTIVENNRQPTWTDINMSLQSSSSQPSINRDRRSHHPPALRHRDEIADTELKYNFILGRNSIPLTVGSKLEEKGESNDDGPVTYIAAGTAPVSIFRGGSTQPVKKNSQISFHKFAGPMQTDLRHYEQGLTRKTSGSDDPSMASPSLMDHRGSVSLRCKDNGTTHVTKKASDLYKECNVNARQHSSATGLFIIIACQTIKIESIYFLVHFWLYFLLLLSSNFLIRDSHRELIGPVCY